jgi:hypothetical protein
MAWSTSSPKACSCVGQTPPGTPPERRCHAEQPGGLVEQQRESPTMNDSGGVNRSLALVVAILLVRCAPFAGATRGGDHDGDLINDLQDACPRASGLLTDDPATSGCPPPPDADHDNILEFADACPNEPGEASEDPSMNGCPDADHDDVIDHNDACPNVAGPRTIDARTNGCPDSDTHRSR